VPVFDLKLAHAVFDLVNPTNQADRVRDRRDLVI
jgi:hypothetical protein